MNTNHYPSLELCKKLTEIGFPKTESFYSRGANKNEVQYFISREEYSKRDDRFVCPSVMEMLDVMKLDKHEGEMKMPEWISIFQRDIDEYELEFHYGDISRGMCHYVRGKNLPNALASMILWLHENNYLNFNK